MVTKTTESPDIEVTTLSLREDDWEEMEGDCVGVEVGVDTVGVGVVEDGWEDG